VSRLLAIDLGLRTGLAVYDEARGLVAYRSQRFANRSQLKRAAWGVLREVEGLVHVVLEGDVQLASVWTKAAQKRGASCHTVQAHDWRKDLLLAREQRSGRDAKEAADEMARRIIAASEAPNPTSLRHDAAEAVLIGWWGAMQQGWLDHPPSTRR